MVTCPAGHTTAANDYCDVCGLPIGAGQTAPATESAPSRPAGARCPNCAALNAPDALFCEACGYDFTTGTLPRSATPPPTAETPPSPAETPPSPVELVETPPQVSSAPMPSQPWDAPAALEASPVSLPPHAGRLLHPQPTTLDWVAEVWIDPDWYATQGSTDALPSPGLPEVVPLRASSALIGRVSVSRNIHPDIDCDPDTGVSRRHAQISTDGTRWWIEDLESANGTFIGASAGPLPQQPIGRGRVEFAPDQRLYLGGWTRIVIRRATDDELQAFTAH
ncbi:FHA domain-containing protein [Micropruina sp.]|uniref:FHA domain-containing protein n=1 Tax=Micropruina sp. TaxID=2737536 RepID=UPI0039E23603